MKFKMYKITYNSEGQKSKCTYETTEKHLFEKYLEELKNDKTVKNIKLINAPQKKDGKKDD